MKNNFLFLSVATIVAWLGVTMPAALAQSPNHSADSPPLERLERQIRQRTITQQPNQPNIAPDQDRAADEPAHETAYLGVVADDREDRGRGVRVLEVRSGSPADRAGFRRQDLITSVGGVRVRQMTDMAGILGTFTPGQTLEIEVLRGESRRKLTVTLATPRINATLPSSPPSSPPEEIPLPPGETAAPSLPSLGPPPPPPAQPDGAPSPDASRIERLERRLQELERRVEQLEKQLVETRKSR